MARVGTRGHLSGASLCDVGNGREDHPRRRGLGNVRFLLNMNVPRELGSRLRGRGHEFRHAGDIGLSRAADSTILLRAKESGETLVTHDLDYGNLLAFSGDKSPSVIIFRLRNTHPDTLDRRVTRAWPEIEAALSGGAIVVLEDAAVRIRRLPVEHET